MIAARLLVPLAAVALVAAGCGRDNKSDSGNTGSNAATTPAPTTTAAPKPQASTGQVPAVKNATDLSKKPEVTTPSGNPPKALLKKDLVVGKGPAIKAGQMAAVESVGKSWSPGEQSAPWWARGRP